VTSNLCDILLWDAFASAVEYFWSIGAIGDVLDANAGVGLPGGECEVRRSASRTFEEDRAADVCVLSWCCSQ
jgi:hypothetical protein